MKAAVELIAEHGVERFTLADVGERAGYSRAHPAKYYRTKAGLLRAVVDHVFRLRPWGQSSEFAGIDVFVRSYLSVDDLLEKRCELVLLAAALTHADLGAHVRTVDQLRVDKVEASLKAGIGANVILDSVNPSAMAIVVTSSVRGALAQWLLAPEGMPIEALRQEVWDTLRYSIGVNE